MKKLRIIEIVAPTLKGSTLFNSLMERAIKQTRTMQIRLNEQNPQTFRIGQLRKSFARPISSQFHECFNIFVLFRKFRLNSLNSVNFRQFQRHFPQIPLFTSFSI